MRTAVRFAYILAVGSSLFVTLANIGNAEAQASIPRENITLSSGEWHVCALRTDGSAVCWGYNYNGQSDPPPNENFVTVSSGADHTCALRSDGSPVCWGENSSGQSDPPPDEKFVAISSGRYYTCALRSDGSPVCWGENSSGQSDPPPDKKFVAISSGADYACALRSDGSPVCWGENSSGQSDPPPDEKFVAISNGGNHTCALRSDGSPVCWGSDHNDQFPPSHYKIFGLLSITSGYTLTCALRSDGSPICWSFMGESAPIPTNERFVSISSGMYHTCALRSDGSPKCWTLNDDEDLMAATPSNQRFQIPESVASPTSAESWPSSTPSSSAPAEPKFISASADKSSPRPTVDIHGDVTRTYLGGSPIRIRLAIVHTILVSQNMTANLLIRIPNGWSLTGEGFTSACTGICNNVYWLVPGENKHIEIEVVPNETGKHVIYAKVEWILDDKSDTDIQDVAIEVDVYRDSNDYPGSSELEGGDGNIGFIPRSYVDEIAVLGGALLGVAVLIFLIERSKRNQRK